MKNPRQASEAGVRLQRKGGKTPAKSEEKKQVKPDKSTKGKEKEGGMPPVRNCFRIHNYEDLRRVYVKIMNEIYQGKLDEKAGGKILYGCNGLAPVLDKIDLLGRLEKLEAIVKGAQGGTNGQQQ